ncbi:low temperature requirement protein A [Lacisediminihabitans changchengi]|uniref:Low temperature requirement protein A n=1 Tax=Lacisediminihabitans changchengi TaxID=2787634 RepID=A0A934SNV4_9MICO|nr:low temperature requirement protein A [Lacisediminihabitans changchengi]MBK4348973.1 low temperature requirement protein A [Lacisediminihabitans changchengi]
MTSAPVGRPWQRPELRDDGTRHRPVGWVELFFDLVFVVIIAVLAHDLEQHIESVGLLTFLLQFVAVFWVWNGFTYYTERFESAGLENRLFVFLAILAVAGLAVWGEDGLGHNYLGFAIAYLAARALNIALWLRAAIHVPRFRRAAWSFAAGFAVAGILILISFVVDEQWRLLLWAAAVVADIASPAVTQRFQADLPPISRDKFPERFGLFTMILLGETIAGVIRGAAESNAESGLSATTLLEAALGLAIGFGLWWLYFDFIARRPTRPVFTVALLWVYLHIAAMASIVVVGAGIAAGIAGDETLPLPGPVSAFLFGGLGAALIAFGLLELTLDRNDNEPTHPRLSPALKFVVGAGLVAVAVAQPAMSTTAAFVIAIAALAVQASYGAIVYYRQR